MDWGHKDTQTETLMSVSLLKIDQMVKVSIIIVMEILIKACFLMG